jgi:antitoxin PrlF
MGDNDSRNIIGQQMGSRSRDRRGQHAEATGWSRSEGGRREADAMARTTLRAKGQLTLPDDVRKAAKLEEGDLIEVVVMENGEVILRPLVAVDRSQAWFWTPEWQAGEREASEQALRGQGETFKDDTDFLDSLQ